MNFEDNWKQPIVTGLSQFFGDDYAAKAVYKELIYQACNSECTFTDKRGKTVQLKRGQVVFGRNQFAKELGWDSGRRCARILEKLEKTYKLLSKQSNTNFTIVELFNYDKLVGFVQANDQAVSKQCPSNVQAMSTSKSVKSVKTEESEKKTTIITSEESLDDQYYLDFWKQVVGTNLRSRASANAQAARRLVNTLGGINALGEVLTIVKAIRGDKYAGTFLFTNSQNYIYLEKSLEAVEAYGNGLIARKNQATDVMLMSKEERAFFNL